MRLSPSQACTCLATKLTRVGPHATPAPSPCSLRCGARTRGGPHHPQLCLWHPLPHTDARSPYRWGRRRWSRVGLCFSFLRLPGNVQSPAPSRVSILHLLWDCLGAPCVLGLSWWDHLKEGALELTLFHFWIVRC